MLTLLNCPTLKAFGINFLSASRANRSLFWTPMNQMVENSRTLLDIGNEIVETRRSLTELESQRSTRTNAALVTALQALLVELEAESENHPQEHVPTNLNIDLSQALHISADVNSPLPADFADATGGVYHPTSPTNEPSQSSENASDTTNLPDDNNSD